MNVRENLVELAPVARPFGLEMRDLQWTVGALGDGERFVHRLEDVIVFIAHVRRVGQPSRRERTAEGDELIAGREGAGRVLQTRRGAARAVGKRLLDELRHTGNLVGGGGAIDVADDDAADGAETDRSI